MTDVEAKTFELPEEVLKSRRNLILMSFSIIVFMLLAPSILELKLAGIEVKFSVNIGLKILLPLLIVFEYSTFYLRYRTSAFVVKLKILEEKKRTINITLESGRHLVTEDNRPIVFEPELVKTERELYDLIRSLLPIHKLSEVYLPTALALIACLWSTWEAYTAIMN